MSSLMLHPSRDIKVMADPEEIVQQVYARCAQAFCRFFTVRVGGDPHTVDDLMQQLWLRARLQARALRDPNPEPWLWRIARNLLREHYRPRSRTPGDEPLAQPDLARRLAQRFDTEDLPPETIARKEVQDQLLLAITEMTGDEQTLLIGRYFEGRTHTELAAILNISERAVEGRLYRARIALREKLAHLA